VDNASRSYRSPLVAASSIRASQQRRNAVVRHWLKVGPQIFLAANSCYANLLGDCVRTSQAAEFDQRIRCSTQLKPA
jgi:hypothetical protein